MGWLWTSAPSGSTPREDKPKSNEERSFALTEEQRQRIFGKPGPAPSRGTTAQDSDKEIEAFINSFDTSPKSTTTTQTTTDSYQQEPTQAPPPSRLQPDGTLSIAPQHMYPRTMSCRQAFDQAFYCQSLGGKFNDIYRYGAIQSCSEQWNAFWFCMRNRTLPMANKEEVIADWFEEREGRRKAEFGSSEDVWALREVAVERAFWRDPEREGQD